MRYALHNKPDSSQMRFKTLTELWAFVRENGLCTTDTDAADVASARHVLRAPYEIHDIDIDGVVRVEGRACPREVG